MKIVFMGTPEFSVPSLKALIEKHEVVHVVTQPDRKIGRGQKVAFSEIKKVAIEHNIPVYQPEKIKDQESVDFLKTIDADLFIVIAYGQLLSEELLYMKKYGSINVHGSILPHLRGPAPIHWSVINGETETGVTIMYMDKGMDTGDMIKVAKMPIGEDATTGEVYNEMCELGAKTLIEVLDDIENGIINRAKQDDDKATYAKFIEKELGHIDFNKETKTVYDLIRGVTPFPSAYFFIDEVKYKIIKAEKVMEKHENSGEVVVADGKNGLVLSTTDGAIKILEIQKQGSKAMDYKAFFNGNKLELGTKVN